jgi:hypothetical protein
LEHDFYPFEIDVDQCEIATGNISIFRKVLFFGGLRTSVREQTLENPSAGESPKAIRGRARNLVPLVRRCLNLTVANVLSIGLVVRKCNQCSAGKS